MIVLWVVLWLMAAILFLTDPKNAKVRWASAISFFSGCGGLAVVSNENLRLWAINCDAGPIVFYLIDVVSTYGSSLAYYIAPCVLLIFSLVYADVRNKWKPTLLLPSLYMYIMYPVSPVFNPDYVVLLAWAGPYICISNGILIYSLWNETNTTAKIQKWAVILVITPTTLFSLLTNFIFTALSDLGLSHQHQVWRMNPSIIGLGFIAFLFFAFKYGFLGIRLRFEKQRLDISLKIATSGTSILNHTIKNEVGKISILANELKHGTNTMEVVDHIIQSSEHVLEMAKRIHYRLNIMEVKKTVFRLVDIIEKSIELQKTELGMIRIDRHYTVDPMVLGDYVHIQEVFSNIFKNAIEAIDVEGEIIVRISEARRQIVVSITDNGRGVENIASVFDPFYTTKRADHNYGLGLTYCYNVMERHGGKLSVQSKLQKGTTVFLSLPAGRVPT